MPEDLLKQLDDSFAAVRGGRAPLRGPTRGTIAAAGYTSITTAARRARWVTIRDRWPWVEWFIYAQFLWGVLLFFPGAQVYRPAIRALPYVSSLALLGLYLFQRRRTTKAPASVSFMLLGLGVLAANLLHPTTQVVSGVAQCVFQLAIAAPIFWAWKAVRDAGQLLRIVRLMFMLNVLSAGVGALQVYYPDTFLPPQFSSLGLQLSASWVDELTYEGAGGRTIVRPPGLSDQPGAAAIAGTFAAVLGLGITLLARGTANRLLGVGGAMLGLFVLYLTQVRSLLLMCVAGFALMAALMFRRGRFAAGTWLLAGGAILVFSAFYWAVSVGGERVERRFTDMTERGAVQTFQENRGHFLSYTFGELLDEYPFGAGVGRWGMMYIYFGDPANIASPPIYVEVQPTGWLLDGGLPLWFCYGCAILAAFATAWRLATQRLSSAVADVASIALPVLLVITGMALASPIFNTQVGILFWFLVGALYGAGHAYLGRRGRRPVWSVTRPRSRAATTGLAAASTTAPLHQAP